MAASPNQVVVVPGFGGTTLSYAGGKGGKTVYWYNPRALLSTNPLAGALANDGVSPFPVFGKTLTVQGPVDWGVYEPLLTALTNAGYNPLFFGYDFRLSASVLAAQFSTFLRRANLSNPFSVVCHSYGGLVAQLAYPIYRASTPVNTWQRTVYAGTPHGGSYWAAAALAGWFPNGSELALLAQVFKLPLPGLDGLKGSIIPTAQGAVGTLLGTWPGLYCLLPNYFGRWASEDPNAILLDEVQTYSGNWGGQQDQWFNAASVVMNSLVANLTTPRPSEVCLAGTGFPTLGKYDGGNADPASISSYTNEDGDGTVTLFRATLPAPATFAVLEGVGHNGLVSSAAGTKEILKALAGEQTGNDLVPFVPPSTIPFPPATTAPFVPIPALAFGNFHSDP